MNSFNVFQKCLVYVCFAGAAACFLAVLAYRFRNQLRALHERWLGLGPLGRVVSILSVTLAVLYGGTKSPTNDLAGATDTGPSACSPMMAMSPQLTHQQTNQLTNWTRRGAYCDWQRIDFPDGFAFPHDTNLLTSITLFAWGEIREEVKVRGEGEQWNGHHCSPSPTIFTFPIPISLEPGASSVTYGLTSNNTFLVSWTNACLNRSATNRIDASIELFRNGSIATLVTPTPTATPTPTPTPTPPAYTYIPAPLPEGFFGSGQDDAWALAAFPDDYDAITNKGYEAWLMEDKVGINEQNGLYKATVTIDQQPITNNQAPIYLVCGPYKVVVTSPGPYSFPLEVFETYKVRTYPVALPLSISTDDGYRGGPSPNLMMSAPRRMLAAPPNNSHEYEICEQPRLVISPDTIPLNQAVGTHVSIWCNIASTARRYSALISREFRLNFCNPSDAEIIAAEVEDLVEIIIDAPLGTCAGTITITGDHLCCGCGSCTGAGCSCGCDCWCHQSSNGASTNSPSGTP